MEKAAWQICDYNLCSMWGRESPWNCTSEMLGLTQSSGSEESKEVTLGPDLRSDHQGGACQARICREGKGVVFIKGEVLSAEKLLNH